tara:strand:+ start:1737 stop:3149 length:1413 start_codon:yes stop_codon:yes gene_type:complete
MTTSSSRNWPSNWRQRLAVGVLILGLGQALGQAEAPSPVQLRLNIPEAPFHVVGDPAPLNWEFINPGKQRLAFMWEGCCRLNGRVSATLGQVTIKSEPFSDPAQLMAHRFARAARLYPGKSVQFETGISDWLEIRRSGTYQLSARYTGLLDNQRPNVTPGWQLWRQSAVSKPVETTLLTAPDYVAKRADLARETGLALGLTKNRDWQPIEGTQLSLTLQNSGDKKRSIAWPSALGLWILDANGRRVPLSLTQIKSAPEELSIKPGSMVKKIVPLDGGALESKPFGAYQIFIDYKTGGKRTPSNTIDIDWRLGQAQLAELLHAASGGAKTGLRNKPLKLLRLHIASLGQALDQVDATRFDAKGQRLLQELKLASRLKPFGPKPGLITVKLSIEKDGTLQFTNQALGQALTPQASVFEKLSAMTAIRRHLGWAVAVELQPKSGVTEKQATQAVESLKTLQPHLVRLPVIKPN